MKAFKWSNFKLHTKLTLSIESLIIAVVMATGIITTVREKNTLESELCKRGLALANDLAQFTVKPLLEGNLATLRRYVNHSMNQEYVRYVSILDPAGKIVMHSDLNEVGRLLPEGIHSKALRAKGPGYETAAAMTGGQRHYNIFYPIRAAEARLGTVLLGYSRAAAEKEIAASRRQIFLVGLVTVIVGGIASFFLSSLISSPIKRITDAMQNVSNGQINSVPDVSRDDEMGILARSFNSMAEDLSRHRRHLEVLVEARTRELRGANEQLQQEIGDRRKAEAELKRSQEQLRDLASHLQSIREEERAQIAREIHDELGQALTALKMDVHWLKQRMKGDPLLADKMNAMSVIIDLTVQTVRRISSELRPKLLDDLGLSAAMEWQANQWMQRAGIVCEIRSEPEDIILDQERSTAFFRVFQETLTNVARHAGADRVHAVITKEAENVFMTVTDNGKGITDEQITGAKSLGIMGMRERVYSLGGTLEIRGSRNGGTTVKVRIPLPKKGECRC